MEKSARSVAVPPRAKYIQSATVGHPLNLPAVSILPRDTTMRTALSFLPRSLLVASAFLVVALGTRADDPQPPKGFTALFNGKDMTGWHGMPHYNPYTLAALTPED